MIDYDICSECGRSLKNVNSYAGGEDDPNGPICENCNDYWKEHNYYPKTINQIETKLKVVEEILEVLLSKINYIIFNQNTDNTELNKE